MSLAVGAIDTTALIAKIQALIYENTGEDISGDDMQEVLIEMIKSASAPSIRCNDSITTTDINKLLMFTPDGAPPVLYQRTAGVTGLPARYSVEFTGVTADRRAHAGTMQRHFTRNPTNGEFFETFVAPRGTVRVNFSDRVSGLKGKYRFTTDHLLPYPVAAKYEINFNPSADLIEGDNFLYPIILDNIGTVGVGYIVVTATPTVGTDALLGATNAETLENIAAAITAFGQWKVERGLTENLLFATKSLQLGYDNYCLPAMFNGFDDTNFKVFGRTDIPVTQTELGTDTWLIQQYVLYMNGGEVDESHNNLLRGARFDGSQRRFIKIKEVLEGDWVTATGGDISSGANYGDFGYVVATDLWAQNWIFYLAFALNDTGVGEWFNQIGNGWGSDEAWFEIEETNVQTGGGASVDFYADFLESYDHLLINTVLVSPALAQIDTTYDLYVAISLDLTETIDNTAYKLNLYEGAHSVAVAWENVDGTDIKSTSEAGFNPQQIGNEWYTEFGATFLSGQPAKVYYTGYQADTTADHALEIADSNMANIVMDFTEWLDFSALPATKEIEASLFRNAVNDHAGGNFTAVIDDDNDAKVNITATHNRHTGGGTHSAAIDITGSGFSNATATLITQGVVGSPETSDSISIGLIAGVVTRGGHKYAVITPNKIKRALLKPHNPISGELNDHLLVGANDGYVKTYQDGDTMHGYAGIYIGDPIGDNAEPTLIDVYELDLIKMFLNN